MEFAMRKILVNGDVANVRTLNPFAYKDLIKALEKSNEARVTVNGVKVFRSAVTSGRDVKAHTGMKYHLYFYATEEAAKVGAAGGGRDWMPITAEEFRAYKADPGYTISLADAEAKTAETPVETAKDLNDAEMVKEDAAMDAKRTDFEATKAVIRKAKRK